MTFSEDSVGIKFIKALSIKIFNHMKNLLTTKIIAAVLMLLSVLSQSSQANWMLNETQQTKNNQDSLPEGISRDWLNSLTDERGNRIIQNGQSNNSEQLPYEDPEGDAMHRKVFIGPAAGSSFGYSASSAGDVNGDGYDDIIVGADGFNNIGRAYIYFGGLNINTVADVVLNGETTGSFFGYSVSGAGDVNGDGYADVIVGAYGHNSNTGKAYIYFGGPNMNSTADVTMTGEAASNLFGFSVSTAGDVNGDGYADVIIGANNFGSTRGKSYVFMGGAAMDNIADIRITGEVTGIRFGYSVSSAGDMNGDGFSDFIIGAYGYLSARGRAYVYFGGSATDTIADIVMTGEASANYFGIAVSTAGDVNGDGYSDAIVGADGYLSDKGRGYVYYGGPSPDNNADFIVTGEIGGSFYGTAVASAGDMNGDGYSDILIGATNINSSAGKMYVYFGGVTPDTTADFSVGGESASNYLGEAVASAGDINGDGYSDIITSAYGNNLSTGKVYLYDYFMKNEIISDVIMTGDTANSSFGRSVSSAGDVNGDGYDDVIVGASGYLKAYIFFGGAYMDNIADVTMTGESTSYNFGLSVSSAGDVNGDGYADVVVGAYGYLSNKGRAYLYLGGASMNNIADVIMTGVATGDEFGGSVSSAGDMNGDGYSDVIIGAAISNNTGRAYLYLGGAVMNNVSDLTFFGQNSLDRFGNSVSSAGDVNRDGYSDVIIGAYNYNTGSSQGKVYIYYGGASPNNFADVNLSGEAGFPGFGYSVSGAGDVNGDGFSDVIIGTIYVTGKVYIYFGSQFMNNVPDFIKTSDNMNGNYFGSSVSSAGDINADGYSDVIVGEYNSPNGNAYVFFGGAAIDTLVDITMEGETISNFFGRSASGAGDVNGDGYDDIISGAYGYSSFLGRAYIYTGSAISAKPILNFVKDVPNDQGGYLNIKWARSSFDVNGNDLVTNYSVLRSFPPSGGNFSWQEVANVTAQKFSSYTFVDDTPYDSTSNSSGTMYYRIKANTNIPSQYWLSGIISGRSIDNIAPLMVSPFTAAAAGSDVRLTWNRSTAPDLLNYILYRNENPTIDPYAETPLGTATDSTFLDTSPLSGSYYYFIIAQDIHGNYSPVAVTQRPSTTLNMSIFIEGFYNAGTNSQISDTITVQLRNTASPFAVVDQSQGILAPDGTIQLTFGNAPSGNYYIRITHRNSIETWSFSGIAFTSGASVSYDFTTALSQAFGSNMKQVDATPMKYGIFVGDQNQDGTVNLNDVVNVYNNSVGFVNGYVTSDMNGDNVTDLSDLVLTSNNAGLFVSKITP